MHTAQYVQIPVTVMQITQTVIYINQFYNSFYVCNSSMAILDCSATHVK